MNFEQVELQLVKNDAYVPAPMQMRTIHIPKALQPYCRGHKTVDIRASNFAQVVRALQAMFGSKVKEMLVKNKWFIRFGSRKSDFITQEDVHNFADHKDIFLYFAATGAGRTAQIIIGVVLIVVGVIMFFGNPYGLNLVMMGAGMILNVLLTPKAQAARAAPDENNSFLFDSPTNVVEQGGAVPLAYGRSLIGSVVLTVGIDTEQIQHYTSPVGSNIAPNSAFGISEL